MSKDTLENMIDAQLVRHIASLAHIGLDESEVERIAHDLEAILGYVKTLEAVDLSAVELVVRSADFVNAVRKDRPAADGGAVPPKTNIDFLEEQAPGHANGGVRVPRIL